MKKKSLIFIIAGVLALVSSFSMIGPDLLFKKENDPELKSTVSLWKNATLYTQLLSVLKELKIKTINDVLSKETVPALNLEIEHYQGICPSNELADALNREFDSRKYQFNALDVTKDMLPQADLIICDGKLNQLTNAQIRAASVLFKKSGAKYLLATHYPNEKKNHKGKPGEYRLINFELAPFYFPKPLLLIKEPDTDYSFALWNIKDLQ